MNALNVPSRSVELQRPLPPLVADMGGGYFLWVEGGHGFTLCTAVGQWHPLTDGEGIGGTLLKPEQLAALVLEFGRPLP
jgi:hypothetical protein